MELVQSKINVPLRIEESGYIRVGATKVRLDQVVFAYGQGHTVESILDSWESLSEPEVYAVIAYYLENRKEVDRYCEGIWREEADIQREWEQLLTPHKRELRERLKLVRERHERERSALQIFA